jgi:hypothetical protein
MDALQFFPENADVIEMAKSRAFLVKKDIFRNLMWYTMPDSNKQYPLTIERVKKIKELNKQGIRPEDLEPADVTSNKPKDIEPVYADVVGQISLKSLEKTSRKRRDNGSNRQGNNRQQGNSQQGNTQQGGSNQNRGNQNQQWPNPNQQNRPQRPPQNRNNEQQRLQQKPNNEGDKTS